MNTDTEREAFDAWLAYAEPSPLRWNTSDAMFVAWQAARASAKSEPAESADIVAAALKWYETGVGKKDVAHELALAVLRYKQHQSTPADQAAPAESEAVRLPPLPEPHTPFGHYTAEQMQAYAITCIAATMPQGQVTPADVEWALAALAQHPKDDQAALRGNAGAPTEAMVTAYLKANDAYWKDVDAGPSRLGIWRDGTPREATHVSLIAALAALADTQPSSHGSEQGQS